MIHYAIQDHGSGATLPELVGLLAGEGVSVDVSLDGSDAALERIRPALSGLGVPVALRRSEGVSWGGRGIATEAIAAMRRALDLPDWRYFLNLSGSCLPLRSPAGMVALLEERATGGALGFCPCYRLARPLEWISSQAEPAAPARCFQLDLYGRVSLRVDPSLREMVEQGRLDPARNIGQRVGLMYSESAKNTYWVRPLGAEELRERAGFLARQPLQYGRAWIVLHRSIVEWLVGSQVLEEVLRFLEGCFIADELIFGMTLFSAENPHRGAMCGNNLRYREGGPQRIALAELPGLIEAGQHLLVRKILAADYPAAAEMVRLAWAKQSGESEN